MKKITLYFCLTILVSTVFAQEKAFQVYTSSGKKTNMRQVFKSIEKSQVVFFGELHNNPISHWLELKLYKKMYEQDSTVLLGLEMFERDNQTVLDDFISQKINRKQLDTLARLWKNFDTDYLPLLKYAQQKHLSVTATNVPRNIANQVYKYGFSVLDSNSNPIFFASLPIEFDSTVACYQNISAMAHHGGKFYLAQAQALKDATMAESIIKKIGTTKTPFLHINGSYHSENKEGICWHLKRMNPPIKLITLTTILQKDIEKLEPENKGKSDFIVVVEEDMTTTY